MTKKLFEMDEPTYQAMLSKRPTVMLIGNVDMAELGMMSINDKWRKLGEVMGFDWETVEPARDKGDHFFWAEPKDPEPQKPS